MQDSEGRCCVLSAGSVPRMWPRRRIGRICWSFISTWRAGAACFSRWPMEMSMTVAMMPPCRDPCGLKKSRTGRRCNRHRRIGDVEIKQARQKKVPKAVHAFRSRSRTPVVLPSHPSAHLFHPLSPVKPMPFDAHPVAMAKVQTAYKNVVCGQGNSFHEWLMRWYGDNRLHVHSDPGYCSNQHGEVVSLTKKFGYNTQQRLAVRRPKSTRVPASHPAS